MNYFEACKRDYTTPRDENGDVWISPARVDKGNLTRNDIDCVKADGTVDGPHPPSSEFPFHRAIYAARPHNRGVAFESLEPSPATGSEKELRRQLCEFIQRGCRQRQLISTEGSFSARVVGQASRLSASESKASETLTLLGNDSFLITPTQQDRETLDIANFVLVDGGRREAGKPVARSSPIRPFTASTRPAFEIE